MVEFPIISIACLQIPPLSRGGGGAGEGSSGRREKLLEKVGRREKMAKKVGRREIYSPVPPPSL